MADREHRVDEDYGMESQHHGSPPRSHASSPTANGDVGDTGEASTNGYTNGNNHGSSHGTTNGEHRAGLPDLESGEAGPLPKPRRTFFQRKREPLPFRERALRVTWAWFPCTMSTGALASLISQQAYTFPGLTTIGTIFYILTIVLWATFTGLIIIRFAHKPRALSTSLHHPSESFFFGAYWVTVALIINGAQAYGGDKTGPWLESAMRVVFWIYFACATVVAVFQYHVIFEVEKLPPSEAVPAWILPAYPFLVTGTVAATIAAEQPQQSATQMIVAGVMGQGLGWILALFIYVVYLTRLIGHNMPAPSTRPGMYVSVGPAAYTCAGLLSLGKQAGAALPDDFLGVTEVPVGAVWQAVSVPAAAFLWLVSVWFSALTTVSIIRVSRRMSFTLQWWAFIFPNAGLGIATIQLGEAVGSPAMQAVASGITIVLVALWLMCAVAHIRAIYRRDLLAVGKDLGVEEVNRRHEEKKLQGVWTEGAMAGGGRNGEKRED